MTTHGANVGWPAAGAHIDPLCTQQPIITYAYVYVWCFMLRDIWLQHTCSLFYIKLCLAIFFLPNSWHNFSVLQSSVTCVSLYSLWVIKRIVTRFQLMDCSMDCVHLLESHMLIDRHAQREECAVGNKDVSGARHHQQTRAWVERWIINSVLCFEQKVLYTGFIEILILINKTPSSS